MSKPIYLDYHSTTPVDLRVAKKVYDYMTNNFGNASSVDHIFGDNALQAVKKAQQQIAQLINCSPQEIIFTSGATESINLVIQGLVNNINNQKKPSINYQETKEKKDNLTTNQTNIFNQETKHKNPQVQIKQKNLKLHQQKSLPCLIISPVEHKAVIDTCQAMAKQELAEIIWLEVDNKGRINLNHLEKVCRQGADLLAVMGANNEIGNIYPLEIIGTIAQRYNIPFLCDGSQVVGKIPINFQDWGITFLTISGHKLYAPKGIGALVIKKGNHLQPLIYGGGHQHRLRSGTLNVSGIVGLGEACYLRQLEMEKDEKEIAYLRDKLQYLLQTKIPELVVNGDRDNRLAGNLHISIPNIPNSAIIARIRDKLAISTGSACTSATFAPSHVLRAMNLDEKLIEGALRIGIGKFTTEAEINQTAKIIRDVIVDLKNILKLY